MLRTAVIAGDTMQPANRVILNWPNLNNGRAMPLNYNGKEKKMSKSPPIPPDNRSGKGPGESDKQHHPDPKQPNPKQRPDNPETQGQSGNTKINTTHQGHQQDR